MRHSNRVLVVLAALPLLYVLAYLILLDASATLPIHAFNYRLDRYRLGGQTARIVFRPLNFIDRNIRPGYWAFEETDEEL